MIQARYMVGWEYGGEVSALILSAEYSDKILDHPFMMDVDAFHYQFIQVTESTS